MRGVPGGKELDLATGREDRCRQIETATCLSLDVTRERGSVALRGNEDRAVVGALLLVHREPLVAADLIEVIFVERHRVAFVIPARPVVFDPESRIAGRRRNGHDADMARRLRGGCGRCGWCGRGSLIRRRSDG